jgi:hypothetical protein
MNFSIINPPVANLLTFEYFLNKEFLINRIKDVWNEKVFIIRQIDKTFCNKCFMLWIPYTYFFVLKNFRYSHPSDFISILGEFCVKVFIELVF